MIRKLAIAAMMAASLASLSGCGIVTTTNRSVFVLFDASGTYAKAVPEAANYANVMIAELQPRDYVGVAQISSCSFSEEAILLRQELPETPSRASAAKRQLFDQLRTYAAEVKPTKFTDIHGALAQAAHELSQRPEKDRFIVVFSDMIEDLAKDCDTSKVKLDLSGIHVVASNVIKSNPSNPEEYFAKLKEWEETVTAAGGKWTLATSPDQLKDIVGDV
jgi:hypothetical protein